MKKIIVIIALILVSMSAFAQNVQWFQATSFACKSVYSSTWSDWEASDVKIKFDFVNQTITIYSQQLQHYTVIRQVPAAYDSNGIQEKYLVMDVNGYNYYVRLRIESNGNSQLYVDASDGSIVYNVRQI